MVSSITWLLGFDTLSRLCIIYQLFFVIYTCGLRSGSSTYMSPVHYAAVLVAVETPTFRSVLSGYLNEYAITCTVLKAFMSNTSSQVSSCSYHTNLPNHHASYMSRISLCPRNSHHFSINQPPTALTLSIRSLITQLVFVVCSRREIPSVAI